MTCIANSPWSGDIWGIGLGWARGPLSVLPCVIPSYLSNLSDVFKRSSLYLSVSTLQLQRLPRFVLLLCHPCKHLHVFTSNFPANIKEWAICKSQQGVGWKKSYLDQMQYHPWTSKESLWLWTSSNCRLFVILHHVISLPEHFFEPSLFFFYLLAQERLC